MVAGGTVGHHSYTLKATNSGKVAQRVVSLDVADIPIPPPETPFARNNVAYPTLGLASAAAKEGEVITMAPGFYPKMAAKFKVGGLHIVCPTGIAVFDAMRVASAESKAVMLVSAPDCVIENFEVMHSIGGDGSISGVRKESGGNLKLKNFYVHDCGGTGVLTGNIKTATLELENGILRRNGLGGGQTHNLYVGLSEWLHVTDVISDDCRGGHEFKSRAKVSRFLRCSSIQGRGSASVDVPEGGEVHVDDYVVYRNSKEGTHKAIIRYGQETEYDPSDLNPDKTKRGRIPTWPEVQQKIHLGAGKIGDASHDMMLTQIQRFSDPTIPILDITPPEVITPLVGHPDPVIESLVLDKPNIKAGESALLSWETLHAEIFKLTIPGAPVPRPNVYAWGNRTVNGDAVGDKVITLKATNPDGKVTERSITLVVTDGATPPVSDPVISRLTMTPASIVKGQSAVLAWTVQGATALTLNGLGVAELTSGSRTIVGNLAGSVDYALEATSAAGKKVQKTVALTVTDIAVPPPVLGIPAVNWDLPSPTPPLVIPPDVWTAADYLAVPSGTIVNFLGTIMDIDPAKEWNAKYPGKDFPWRGVSGIGSHYEHSGSTFVRGFGTLGGIFTRGGGHDGYYGNWVSANIIGARKAARITYPYTHLVNFKGYFADPDNGECYTNLEGTATDQSQIAPSHTYGYFVSCEKGIGNNDPQGMLLSLSATAQSRGGSQASRRAHSLPLTTPPGVPPKFERFSLNLAARAGGYDGGLVDKVRKRAIMHDFDGNFQILDLTTRLWLPTQKTNSPLGIGYYGTWMHLLPQDLYVWFLAIGNRGAANSSLVWLVIDPDTWEIFKPGIDGALPNFTQAGGGGTSGAATYNPTLQSLVYHPGGGNNLYYLGLPGNLKTQKLAVAATRTFGGAPGETQYPGASYLMTRFNWHADCKGYFYGAKVNVPMQFWKE